MTEKYLQINLDDEKSGKLAEVLTNKTCKKILNLISEKELSQSDIARELKLAANTVDYNINKLLDATLIEKSSNYFWSVKGKKMPTYRLANKKIIISTKNSFRGILSSMIFGGILFGIVKLFMNYTFLSFVNSNNKLDQVTASMAPNSAETLLASSKSIVIENQLGLLSNVWIWILIGLIVGALGFILYKKLKGGNQK